MKLDEAFGRTIRGMHKDNFRLSTMGLGAAIALLAVWSWWMISARVSILTVSGGAAKESPAHIALRASGVPDR